MVNYNCIPCKYITKNKYVICVGRLEIYKGIYTVLEAAGRLNNKIDFIFIGHGPEKKNLCKQINNAGLNKSVAIFDYDEDWRTNYNNACALVSMSNFEGSPNVVLEAIMAGIPLILSDISAHREILDDLSAFFIEPNNSHKLSECINRVTNIVFNSQSMVYNASKKLKDFDETEVMSKLNFEFKRLV